MASLKEGQLLAVPSKAILSSVFFTKVPIFPQRAERFVRERAAGGEAHDRAGSRQLWPTRDGDVWLPVAPFTHIYGYLMGVTNPLLRGGTLVIPPQFQPALVVDMLTEHRVTVFGGGPPAIYQAVLAAPNFQSADLSHLRVCPGGGAPRGRAAGGPRSSLLLLRYDRLVGRDIPGLPGCQFD